MKIFLAGAELYTLRKEYSLDVFMLHQPAEQALNALLTLYTGLRVQAHNLDKLARYRRLFCPAVFYTYRDGNSRCGFSSCSKDISMPGIAGIILLAVKKWQQ